MLENGNIYRAGDVGRTVFFVYSGRVQVTLSADRKALDAFGVASLRLLLHKQTHHGPVYEKGDHFGELCLLSSAGLRADTAQALSGCEMYYLVKEELWDEFTYIEPKMRREFIHDLFSRVGKTKHCHSKVDKTHQDDTSDTRITSLFRMAFGIMEDIYDELDGEDQDDSSVHDELNDSPDTAENPQESTVEDFDHFVDQSTLISPNDGSPTIARRSALVRKAGSGNFEEDLAVESVPGSRKHSSAGGVNETPHSTSTVLRKSNKSSDQEDLAALIKQDSEVRSDRRFSDMHKHRVFLHRKRSVFSAVAIMTKHKLQILQDEQNNPQKFQLTLDKLCDGELIDSTKALSDEKNDDERTVPIAPICTPHPLTHLTHLSPDVGRRKHAPLRISNASSKLPTLRERVDTSSSHSPPQDNFSSDSPVSPGLSKKDVLAIATKKFKQMAQKGSDPKFSAPEGNGHDDVETFLCDLEDDNNAFRPKERHQSHMEISDMDD
ncbi:cyclic nucleotide-binding domain-containing protein [archaeon]|nr:MAG: cyclic nucleotide-binding domain-containing protein [archaeon]